MVAGGDAAEKPDLLMTIYLSWLWFSKEEKKKQRKREEKKRKEKKENSKTR